MKSFPILALSVLLLQARADSLEAIFARMDEASKKFKSVSARIHETKYTAVIDDKTEEDSKLAAKRAGNGIRGRLEFFGPDARTVAFKGNLVEMYWPKGKQVEDFDISKYTSPNTLDQLLLLSFGAASGAEIQKDYDVSPGGAETVDSKTVTRVELVPKAADLKKGITRITLWIPEGESRAIKERADQPSKDYLLWTYSDVKLNGNMPDSEVELKLPPGVKRIGTK